MTSAWRATRMRRARRREKIRVQSPELMRPHHLAIVTDAAVLVAAGPRFGEFRPEEKAE